MAFFELADGNCRGFGFVNYATVEEATKALTADHNVYRSTSVLVETSSLLVASLLLIAMPFAPSSFLLLVVKPSKGR